jgi:hypothetical protein
LYAVHRRVVYKHARSRGRRAGREREEEEEEGKVIRGRA